MLSSRALRFYDFRLRGPAALALHMISAWAVLTSAPGA
ncbi:hypothetical protein Bra471DRAFT_03303 [Bradyrhizobium sp. WSM471]|nr:hypothetical protein Bra471DRAFT_03303 [Bradyrhizobium sp. WSM471]